jgi:hypothetical protein
MTQFNLFTNGTYLKSVLRFEHWKNITRGNFWNRVIMIKPKYNFTLINVSNYTITVDELYKQLTRWVIEERNDS